MGKTSFKKTRLNALYKFLFLLVLGILGFMYAEAFSFVQENKPFSSWITFRSRIFGYEIKYPGDWIIISNPPNDISIESVNRERINVFIQRNETELHIDSWITINFKAISFKEKLRSFKRIVINKALRRFEWVV